MLLLFCVPGGGELVLLYDILSLSEANTSSSTVFRNEFDTCSFKCTYNFCDRAIVGGSLPSLKIDERFL